MNAHKLLSVKESLNKDLTNPFTNRFSPIETIGGIFDAIDQLAEEVISPKFRPRLKEIYQANSKFPPLEILEEKENLIIKLYVSGYDKENIEVEYDKETEYFIISGSSRHKTGSVSDSDPKVTYSEIKRSSFKRAIPVPLDQIANINEISTKIKDGILEIKVPYKHKNLIKEEQKKKFLIE